MQTFGTGGKAWVFWKKKNFKNPPGDNDFPHNSRFIIFSTVDKNVNSGAWPNSNSGSVIYELCDTALVT